jgi:hypothetical protein
MAEFFNTIGRELPYAKSFGPKAALPNELNPSHVQNHLPQKSPLTVTDPVGF